MSWIQQLIRRRPPELEEPISSMIEPPDVSYKREIERHEREIEKIRAQGRWALGGAVAAAVLGLLHAWRQPVGPAGTGCTGR